MRDVALEFHIADSDYRLHIFRGWIRRVMNLEVGIDLFVCLDDVVNEPLPFCPPPAGLRTEIPVRTGVFSAGDLLCRALAVAFPMELAAGIYDPLSVEIAGIEDIPYKRIIVIQFGIACRDGSRFDRFSLFLCTSCRHHHNGSDSTDKTHQSHIHFIIQFRQGIPTLWIHKVGIDKTIDLLNQFN